MSFGVCAVGVLLVEFDGIGGLASCVERSEHIFDKRITGFSTILEVIDGE